MYVYRVGLKDQIESIFKHGFSRQYLNFHEGSDYGDGVYCNINIEDSLKRLYHTKDGCVFKCEIIDGLNRYLIFNGEFAGEVYGGNSTIKEQVEYLFQEDAPKVWRDFVNIMKHNYDTRNHMEGRTAGLLQILLSPRKLHTLKQSLPPEDRHRNVRQEYEMLFKKHDIRGAIYRGYKDGLCLVAYDFSRCIPVAYSIDGGRTFKEKAFEGDEVDVQKKYGLKYEKVDFPVTLFCQGQKYQFSRVIKKNGKMNYINIKTGEEFSPFDFDSATLINNKGKFTLEYKENHFDAYPNGFVDKNGKLRAYKYLEKAVNEEKKRFSNILENALNKVYSEVTYKSLINENFVDEVKYGEFELPTEDEINSNKMTTIYHVTEPSSVDGIFKFQCDREFKAKNANVYGAGVYTTISIRDSKRLFDDYGGAMIEFKLIGGFKNFIILQEHVARQVYGEKCDILSQLKTFLSEKDAEYLYRQCGRDVKSYSFVAGKYNIRGAIYPWCGLTAVLPFDFSALIPYAVSYDGGNTFQKKFNNDTMQRMKTSIDVEYRYGHSYKFVSKAIAGKNEKKEPTGYAKVLKHDGKWNIIDIQTGEEKLPIDFTSITTMNPSNGSFTIEYKGKSFLAYLNCFIDENGKPHQYKYIDKYV